MATNQSDQVIGAGRATPTLFDVIAVNIVNKRVRLMDTTLPERTAESCVRYAVWRRGVEEEFFVAVPAGQYQEGDTWPETP